MPAAQALAHAALSLRAGCPVISRTPLGPPAWTGPRDRRGVAKPFLWLNATLEPRRAATAQRGACGERGQALSLVSMIHRQAAGNRLRSISRRRRTGRSPCSVGISARAEVAASTNNQGSRSLPCRSMRCGEPEREPGMAGDPACAPGICPSCWLGVQRGLLARSDVSCRESLRDPGFYGPGFSPNARCLDFFNSSSNAVASSSAPRSRKRSISSSMVSNVSSSSSPSTWR